MTTKDFKWKIRDINIDYRDCFNDYPGVDVRLDGVMDCIKASDKRSTITYGDIVDDLQARLDGTRLSGPLPIKDVIFNKPATIILWEDGTKTVVKAQEGDGFDLEKGFVMAYLKKLLGNDNTFNKVIEAQGFYRGDPDRDIHIEEKLMELEIDRDTYKIAYERVWTKMAILDRDAKEICGLSVEGLLNKLNSGEITLATGEPKVKDDEYEELHALDLIEGDSVVCRAKSGETMVKNDEHVEDSAE